MRIKQSAITSDADGHFERGHVERSTDTDSDGVCGKRARLDAAAAFTPDPAADPVTNASPSTLGPHLTMLQQQLQQLVSKAHSGQTAEPPLLGATSTPAAPPPAQHAQHAAAAAASSPPLQLQHPLLTSQPAVHGHYPTTTTAPLTTAAVRAANRDGLGSHDGDGGSGGGEHCIEQRKEAAAGETEGSREGREEEVERQEEEEGEGEGEGEEGSDEESVEEGASEVDNAFEGMDDEWTPDCDDYLAVAGDLVDDVQAGDGKRKQHMGGAGATAVPVGHVWEVVSSLWGS